jgi:RimJ/RimL family protein N-acetyltransferase
MGADTDDIEPLEVAIRPYAACDLPLLQRLLGDLEMTVHLGGPESPEALLARHERYLASDGSTDGLFTIVVGAERVAAGWVGYWETFRQSEEVWECGWHVLPEYQGVGVATAVVPLALEHARARGRHRFVHAFPSLDNVASNALCRRLGFACLGEVDVEYPKGCTMHARDWRLDLGGE